MNLYSKGILESLRPDLDAIHDVYAKAYEAGIAEGRRRTCAELLPTIVSLQAQADQIFTKTEDADPSLKTAGEKNNGPESSQTRNRKAVETEVPHQW